MPRRVIRVRIGWQDGAELGVKLVGPRRPVEELAVPTGDGAVVTGDADQRVGPRCTRSVGIPPILEQLLRQLRTPQVMDQWGVVEHHLVAGEGGRIRCWPSCWVLRPEPELCERVGTARGVIELGNLSG